MIFNTVIYIIRAGRLSLREYQNYSYLSPLLSGVENKNVLFHLHFFSLAKLLPCHSYFLIIALMITSEKGTLCGKLSVLYVSME